MGGCNSNSKPEPAGHKKPKPEEKSLVCLFNERKRELYREGQRKRVQEEIRGIKNMVREKMMKERGIIEHPQEKRMPQKEEDKENLLECRRRAESAEDRKEKMNKAFGIKEKAKEI
ncbi:unnamed protein product [Moneuplotes crassus]|uniref:Uncharacterized protein n=1 Tax=Euplotes crassus TaxID=5936 RepID=A0AAD1XI20_EUPCR|nr:unnamed protein product [Moneuplotes crassus]